MPQGNAILGVRVVEGAEERELRKAYLQASGGSQVPSPTGWAQKPSTSRRILRGAPHLCPSGALCLPLSRNGELTHCQGSLLYYRIVRTRKMCFLQLNWSFVSWSAPRTPNTHTFGLPAVTELCTLCLILLTYFSPQAGHFVFLGIMFHPSDGSGQTYLTG